MKKPAKMDGPWAFRCPKCRTPRTMPGPCQSCDLEEKQERNAVEKKTGRHDK